MCFKTPKPPPPSDTGQDIADPALTRERQQAEVDASVLKAENKQRRMEDQLALLQGKIGRRSLFSGGQGGAGYAAPTGRSLFVLNKPPTTGGTGGTSGGGGRPRRPVFGGGDRPRIGSLFGPIRRSISAQGPPSNRAANRGSPRSSIFSSGRN